MNEQVFLKTISPETTEGILLVDKPVGVTSHDVVDWARRVTGVRKIGHSGTLDPLATGLLCVLIGRKFTKLQPTFLHQDKSYTVSFIVGVESPTLDVLDQTFTQKLRSLPRKWWSIPARLSLVKKSISHYENKVFTENEFVIITKAQLEKTLNKFTTSYQQKVPVFSAVKVKGSKLYEIGRKGSIEGLEIPEKPVQIHALHVTDFTYDTEAQLYTVTLEVHCGSGTYIRSLVRDIANDLDTVAVVTSLRRTSIGCLSIQDVALCPLL